MTRADENNKMPNSFEAILLVTDYPVFYFSIESSSCLTYFEPVGGDSDIMPFGSWNMLSSFIEMSSLLTAVSGIPLFL